MLNIASSTWIVVGVWFATLAVVVAGSVAMDARFSTSVFLLALGVVPGVVLALVAGRSTSPSVAEILHPIETRDGR